jgi:hypothetical protein
VVEKKKDEQLELFPVEKKDEPKVEEEKGEPLHKQPEPVEDLPDGRITGYRALTTEEVAWINTVKSAELELGAVWRNVKELVPDADGRCMSEAKTCFQTGFKWLVKAIAKPEDAF